MSASRTSRLGLVAAAAALLLLLPAIPKAHPGESIARLAAASLGEIIGEGVQESLTTPPPPGPAHPGDTVSSREQPRFRLAAWGQRLHLSAQQAPPPGRVPPQGTSPPREGRQEMMNRIQQEWERELARELSLTPRQMEGLRGVFVEFRMVRGELMRERFQLAQDMERHRRQAAGNEAEARRLLDRARALRAREVDLQRVEEERLLEVISPSQLLRLHQMRDDFSDRIRRLEGQTRPGGRPGPGAG